MQLLFHVRILPLLAVLLALAGCNTNPLIVEITDCPAVGFVRYANSLTAFPQDQVPTADQVQYRAILSNLNVDCQDEGEGLTARVTFTITAEPGPQSRADTITVPYFVAVVRKGDELRAKTLYNASVSMTGPDGRGRTRETLDFSIPTNALADQYLYEVLVGFALTNQQARYNLES